MADSSSAEPRHYDYGQMIEFVRPAHTNIIWKLQPAPETPTCITGDEARSFYENLCTVGDSCRQEKSGSSTSRTTNSKRKPSSQRYKKKRLCLEESNLSCLEDVGVTGNLYEVSETSFSSNDADNLVQVLSKAGTPGDYPSASGSSSCASKKRDSCNETEKSSSHQRLRDHRQSELFRLAQHGITEDVRALVSKGVDVNCTDIFGWTATMSAAFEGHLTVVQTLVKSGADLAIRNSQGHTASSLAQKKGHNHVVQFIDSFQGTGLAAFRPKRKQKECTIFLCDLCKSEFSDSDQKAHNRSTLHIFNMGLKPKDDSFLIPPSNVGYRLMMKTGWDGSRGLGPSGKGQKYPVKTFLKLDRKGLGNAVKNKAKVTHFKANDRSAVERMGSEGDRRIATARTLSRQAQKAKERRERQWEINVRRQLS